MSSTATQASTLEMESVYPAQIDVWSVMSLTPVLNAIQLSLNVLTHSWTSGNSGSSQLPLSLLSFFFSSLSFSPDTQSISVLNAFPSSTSS